MKYFIDLHMHSHYSRATGQLNLENLEQYGKMKGLHVLGTGDFQHPIWMKELQSKLTEENGILRSKTGYPFIWQTEIALIYTQGGKGRRIHHLLYAPNKEAAVRIQEFLGSKGRLDYDGRPIFGFSSIELVEAMQDIHEKIEVVPAHLWTPWFGALGSMSGFDSLQECFQDQAKHVHAIETGMSSDPEMNWRVPSLDGITLLSNSDAHSYWPWRMGRECNVFDLKDLTYDAVVDAIRTRKGLSETIEVDPGYGKYHVDGHRNCDVSFEPEQTKKLNGICPKCGKKLTIGVLNRVEELAKRPEGYKPEDAVPFKTLIPLSELIASVLQAGIATKKVWAIYNDMLKEWGDEYSILLNADGDALKKIHPEVGEMILANRAGKIKVKPGYDGVYGEIVSEEESQEEFKPVQKNLGEF